MSFKPYLNQDYEAIKAQCLKSGRLFEDDKFPANASSIARFNKNLASGIVWKRPHEFVQNPQFVVGKVEPNDLDQGQLGNCWVVASMAALADVPDYLNRVIPSNQSFDKANYAGVFHFRFWVNGEWVDVVVDDRIPVSTVSSGPAFCKNSVDTNEMFGPLLEKAYAKLNICYEFLVGGNPKDALIDFTGGINEGYDLTRSRSNAKKDRFIEPNKLWELMFKSYQIKSLMSCAANPKPTQKLEDQTSNGLVVGHAYSILALYEIYSKNGTNNALRGPNESAGDPNKTIKLLRIRNPWGKQVSYKGSWSSGAKDWNQIADNVKQLLNPSVQTDGQFYMSFTDYYNFFDTMDTVHIDINGLSDDGIINNAQYKWDMVKFNGAWVPGQSSGGPGMDQNAFWTNPQYEITIPSFNSKPNTAIIVSLLQTESAQRRLEKTGGQFNGSYEALGFYIYSIKPGSKKINDKYDKNVLTRVNQVNVFLYQKEMSKRCEHPPGNYIVIPCLYEKDKAMKFLLRVYIESTGAVSKPNPAPGPPTPIAVPNNNTNNNNNKPAIDPVNPTPKPNPTNPSVVPVITNNYDKWYFNGMKQNDIDNYTKQAQLATSKACSIM